jgi:hypothetical protein
VSWTDANVTLGQVWEYQVRRSATWTFNGSTYDAIGYTIGSLNADNTTYQGQMILLVANDIVSSLAAKYTRLIKELTADGWYVNVLQVARATSWDMGSAVVTIRGQIQTIYNNAPANDKPKLLFILGHVPMPRSGTDGQPPDGHETQMGARGCDAYYADIDGVWTDVATYNPGGLTYPIQINIPGDYKWDQNFIPSDIEMSFGRVDFADLIRISQTEMQAYSLYLDRLSNYKNVAAGWNMGTKAGYWYNDQPASNDGAFRSLPNIAGSANVYEDNTSNHPQWVKNNGPFKIYMQNYLEPDTAQWRVYGMDATIFSSDKSFWGYNDYAQEAGWYMSDIRKLLSLNTKCLGIVWSITGLKLFHQAATGQSFGMAIKQTINHTKANNYLEKPEQYFDSYDWWKRAHLSFTGDPTIRLYQVSPPSNPTISESSGVVTMSWTASPDVTILGYNIYESATEFGIYTKKNNSLITGTNTTINGARNGYWYMVKAVKQFTSGSGKFINPSLGVSVIANIAQTTNYYVSNSGNDANNGLTPATAWATITKVNSSAFLPGDSILFKRGDTWRTTISMNESGSLNKHIVFGAYGTGNKPKLLGSEQISSWTNVSGNIWVSTQNITANPYTINYGAQIFFNETNGSTTWGNYKTYTSNYSNLVLSYDWTWNGNKIYVYSITNPTSRYLNVECPQREDAILVNSQGYFTLDNLFIGYLVSTGLRDAYGDVGGNAIRVTNCEIGYIGVKGSSLAFGLSVTHSNSYYGYNNIHDCGRRSISINLYATTPIKTMRNVIIEHNYLHDGFHTTGVDCINSGDHLIDSIIIRNNYFEGNPATPLNGVNPNSNHVFVANQTGGTGLVSDIYVYNNIFTYLHGKGVGLETVDTAEVYYNTFYGWNPTLANGQNMVSITGTRGTAIVIKNNIFYHDRLEASNPALECVWVSNAATTFPKLDNNLYYSTDANVHILEFYQTGTGYFDREYRMSQWADYHVQYPTYDANSPTPANPLFVNAPTNLALQLNSSAINKAVVIPWITTDYYGNIRSTVSPTLGAIEYAGAASTATNILTFSILNQNSSIVNNTSHTVTIYMPFGTNKTSLIPTISTSAGATISPVSGTAINFTSPVNYTVTAEDGITLQIYTVTVNISPATMISKSVRMYGKPIKYNGRFIRY